MEITANALQTVAAGSNVIFTSTAVPSNVPCVIVREGSGLTTLRGITTNSCRARFRATFGANIAVPTGETPGAISLAIALNGEPLAASTMTVTPAAVEEFFNVGRTVFIDVPSGCCAQLSVENISTIPVNVQNASFIVERVA